MAALGHGRNNYVVRGFAHGEGKVTVENAWSDEPDLRA